ncbi:hypothetical protein AgCh_014146 [Apium graveolens]
MVWVINGGSWTFDNAMLCLDVIPQGVDPLKVPLWFLNIWIQIHDLPSGFMSETVGLQLGNFFGEFLLYDAKNNTSIWKECMRIKIKIDVRKPLKRNKKINRKNVQEFVVTCKYERLGDFCFSCGMVSHTDRFCRRYIDKRDGDGTNEWGAWLREPSWRGAGQSSSKWLREEGDADWEERIGCENSNQRFGGVNFGSNDRGIIIRSEMWDNEGKSTTNSVVAGQQQDNIFMTRETESSKISFGPGEEESIGLITEARKRSRTGHETKGTMDIE